MLPHARQTILIVEDDADLRYVFSQSLRAAGFDVLEASDGLEALRVVENNPPDAVVLDLVLPMLDGISVREEIAAHAETRRIPVVVVTGATLDAHRLNVASILRKPVASESLVEAVRTALFSGDGG